MLTGAAQSRAALERKLVRRGFDTATASAAAIRMVDYGYINDQSLADSVSRRRVSSGKGPARIAADLRRMQVDPEVVEATVAGLDPDQMRDEALALARSLARRVPDEDPTRRRRRIGSALQRRGHGVAVIHGILAELASSGDEA